MLGPVSSSNPADCLCRAIPRSAGSGLTWVPTIQVPSGGVQSPARCDSPDPMRETELYPPIKALFEAQGYTVKGEVGAADVVAMRGDEPAVIVELKTGFAFGAVPSGGCATEDDGSRLYRSADAKGPHRTTQFAGKSGDVSQAGAWPDHGAQRCRRNSMRPRAVYTAQIKEAVGSLAAGIRPSGRRP